MPPMSLLLLDLLNPIVVTDPDCVRAHGKFAVGIFPTAIKYTGSKGPGSQVRIDFQVQSRSPVVEVAVRTPSIDTDLVSMQGTNLTGLAGLWFTFPTVSGAYPLFVLARNSHGCSAVQSTSYVLRVP